MLKIVSSHISNVMIAVYGNRVANAALSLAIKIVRVIST